MRLKRLLWTILLMTFASTLSSAQSAVVVFHEAGFPAADSVAAPDSFLRGALSGAQFASSGELKERLGSAKLLVLPYGSAFPEESWPDIYGSLQAPADCRRAGEIRKYQAMIPPEMPSHRAGRAALPIPNVPSVRRTMRTARRTMHRAERNREPRRNRLQGSRLREKRQQRTVPS